MDRSCDEVVCSVSYTIFLMECLGNLSSLFEVLDKRANIFQRNLSWKRTWALTLLTHGRAFGAVEAYFSRVLDGELGLAPQSTFGRILGYLVLGMKNNGFSGQRTSSKICKIHSSKLSQQPRELVCFIRSYLAEDENKVILRVSIDSPSRSIDTQGLGQYRYPKASIDTYKLSIDTDGLSIGARLGSVSSDYRIPYISSSRPYGHASPSPPKWSSPPSGMLKTNFDASFDDLTKTSVVGISIRDSNGLIMGASTHPPLFQIQKQLEPKHVQTVLNTHEFGFQKAIFEAHLLAKMGRNFPSNMFWVEEAPAEVEAAATHDRWWVDPPD
ncbi:hypothetical protein F3Y22_tig00000773pilonHSYRG00057 [Hibiscus syriacus]|uniref:RNase H type-1 domain-containing protein n=1 Tax=Hibiscus syriacus TaxID=106335 RepID=A0A6A3D382_HIBSY|nr:hypothetical protein F3Y22_tig00000773pilonHSYRG00057 [Hibiscus syriacus]